MQYIPYEVRRNIGVYVEPVEEENLYSLNELLDDAFDRGIDVKSLLVNAINRQDEIERLKKTIAGKVLDSFNDDNVPFHLHITYAVSETGEDEDVGVLVFDLPNTHECEGDANTIVDRLQDLGLDAVKSNMRNDVILEFPSVDEAGRIYDDIARYDLLLHPNPRCEERLYSYGSYLPVRYAAYF